MQDLKKEKENTSLSFHCWFDIWWSTTPTLLNDVFQINFVFSPLPVSPTPPPPPFFIFCFYLVLSLLSLSFSPFLKVSLPKNSHLCLSLSFSVSVLLYLCLPVSLSSFPLVYVCVLTCMYVCLSVYPSLFLSLSFSPVSVSTLQYPSIYRPCNSFTHPLLSSLVGQCPVFSSQPPSSS